MIHEVSAEEAVMHLTQRHREEQSRQYARDRARERQQKLAEAGMFGDLDGARKEANTAVDAAIQGLEEFIQVEHDPRSMTARLVPIFKALSPEDRATLVSDSMDLMFNSVDNVNLTTLIHRLGELVEVSLNLIKQRSNDRKLTQWLKEKVERQADAAGRMRTIRYELQVNQKAWERWDEVVKVRLGQILLHVVMERTDLFETEVKEVPNIGNF